MWRYERLEALSNIQLHNPAAHQELTASLQTQTSFHVSAREIHRKMGANGRSQNSALSRLVAGTWSYPSLEAFGSCTTRSMPPSHAILCREMLNLVQGYTSWRHLRLGNARQIPSENGDRMRENINVWTWRGRVLFVGSQVWGHLRQRISSFEDPTYSLSFILYY
jgi:hypothetical protein